MEGHMLAVVLFIVMVSSEEVKKNLTGTVGGSVTLPDPVEKEGFLLFERKLVTLVNDRKIVTYDEAYKDKVLWNNNSGLFTITRLQKSDSGIYTVDSKKGKVFSHLYKLTVYVMVSSEEVKKNLTGTVGGSITLPDPVEEGFLLFERKVIATLTNRQIKTLDKIYKDKVLWNNNNTGLFTITRLQKNNSGIYSIQYNTEGAPVNFYKLTVYESVPTPAVETLDVSAESCTLQCLVEKAEETTLLWYKDEQILNQSSSSLSLPLTVLKKDFKSSYRCVAANPADQKTSPVNMTACGAENEPNNPNNSERHCNTNSDI